MALKITCPKCAAAFGLGEDMRGAKVFCPKCGKSLFVSSVGVVIENTRARFGLGRGVNPLWLLVVVLLSALAFGLTVYLLSSGHADRQKEVAKNDGDPPPAPHHEDPADTPHRQPIKERAKNPADEPHGQPIKEAVKNPADEPHRVPKKENEKPADKLPAKPLESRPISPVEKPAQLINNEQTPANALALPAIGGWVMLSDNVTLIVALPEQKQLVYIDTVANKELKRVKLPFTPYALAVQRKRLFVSAQAERSELHILDLDTAEDKKTITLPGQWLTDMICDREKGWVYAFGGPGHMAIDPDAGAAGSAEPVHIDLPAAKISSDPRLVGYNAWPQFLAMDPKNANALFAIVRVQLILPREAPEQQPWLMKLAVAGKDLKAIWAVQCPVINAPYLLALSGDGKRAGVYLGGSTTPGGKLGIGLFDLNTVRQAFNRAQPKFTGVAACGATPAGLALHPVLDLGVAEQDGMVQLPSGAQAARTVLHLFNCESLKETTFTFSANNKMPRDTKGRLLTFGGRGTKLLYYDNTTGHLRSIPLTLTDKDKEALAKAYPIPK